MFSLSYVPPPRDLIDYVSAFYMFESDDAVVREVERADIAQLRFLLAGEAEIIFAEDDRHSMAPVSLFGPRMKASHVDGRGPSRMFGCGLPPAGWLSVTGAGAAEYANRVVDATMVFGAETPLLHARIAAAGSIEAMAEILSEAIRTRVAASTPIPVSLIRTVDEWLEASMSPELADLEAATGLSLRQLEKQVKAIYGAPPKLLARKYRALKTANAIAHGEGEWQDHANDHYYDHSHCIRDIKEFMGVTPSAIREAGQRLAGLNFGRRKLEGTIAPLSAKT